MNQSPDVYLMCKLVERAGDNVTVEVATFDDSRKPYRDVIHTAAKHFANVDGRDCIEVVPSLSLKGWVVTFPTVWPGTNLARGSGAALPVPESNLIYGAR